MALQKIKDKFINGKVIFSKDGSLAITSSNILYQLTNGSWSEIGAMNIAIYSAAFNNLSPDFSYCIIGNTGAENGGNATVYKRNGATWSSVSTITHPEAFYNISTNRNDPNVRWRYSMPYYEYRTCYAGYTVPAYDCSYYVTNCTNCPQTCVTNTDKTSSNYGNVTCTPATLNYVTTRIPQTCGGYTVPERCNGCGCCVGGSETAPYVNNEPSSSTVSSYFGHVATISENGNYIAITTINGIGTSAADRDSRGRGIGSLHIYKKGIGDTWAKVQDYYPPEKNIRSDYTAYLTYNGKRPYFNNASQPRVCNPLGNHQANVYADLEIKYYYNFLATLGISDDGKKILFGNNVFYNSNPSVSNTWILSSDKSFGFYNTSFFINDFVYGNSQGWSLFKFDPNKFSATDNGLNKINPTYLPNTISSNDFIYYVSGNKIYKLNLTTNEYEFYKNIFANDNSIQNFVVNGIHNYGNNNITIFLSTKGDYQHNLSDSNYKNAISSTSDWYPSTNDALYILKTPFDELGDVVIDNNFTKFIFDSGKIDNKTYFIKQIDTYGTGITIELKFAPPDISYNSSTKKIGGQLVPANGPVGYWLAQLQMTDSNSYSKRLYYKFFILPSVDYNPKVINRIDGDLVNHQITINNLRNVALGYNETTHAWSSSFKTVITSVKKNGLDVDPVNQLPKFISFNQQTDTFDGTVTPEDLGKYTVICNLTTPYFKDLTIPQTLSFNFGPKIISPDYATGRMQTYYANFYQIQIPSFYTTNPTNAYDASNLPPGLSINKNTGIISGTATKEGSYTITLFVTTSGGGSSSKEVNIKIGPKIYSSSQINVKLKENFSYQILAYGNPVPIGDNEPYSAVGLIDGLNINKRNGTLSGYIDRGVGSYKVLLSAFNPYGYDEIELTINVGPKIIDDLVLSAKSAKIYNHKILIEGDYDVISAVGLPPGLVISNDGFLNGIIKQNGVFEGYITVSNGTYGSDTKKFTITSGIVINGELKVKTTINENFYYKIQTSIFAQSYDAKNLFGNLKINKLTGVISGSFGSPGTFKILIYASDYNQQTESELIVEVGPRIVLDTKTLNIEFGKQFSYRIRTEGNPILFSASDLPLGLSIDSRGYITGIPRDFGSFNSKIYVSNNLGSDFKNLDITVFCSLDDILNAYKTYGDIGKYFTYNIYAKGAVDYYGAENLPAGLSINSSNGKITGEPLIDGIFKVKIYVKYKENISYKYVYFYIKSLPKDTSDQFIFKYQEFYYPVEVFGKYINISVEDLPEGLTYNSQLQSIQGIIKENGTYTIKIKIENEAGISTTFLKIIVSSEENLDYKVRYKMHSLHFGAYHDNEKYYSPKNNINLIDMYKQYSLSNSSSSSSRSSSSGTNLTLEERINLLQSTIDNINSKIPSSSSSSESSSSSSGPLEYVGF